MKLEQTIQQHLEKLPLPRKFTLADSLIAATCLEHGYTLATCNTEDFDWIGELKAFNPLVSPVV